MQRGQPDENDTSQKGKSVNNGTPQEEQPVHNVIEEVRVETGEDSTNTNMSINTNSNNQHKKVGGIKEVEGVLVILL